MLDAVVRVRVLGGGGRRGGEAAAGEGEPIVRRRESAGAAAAVPRGGRVLELGQRREHAHVRRGERAARCEPAM